MRTTQNPKTDTPYAEVRQVERSKWRIQILEGDYTFLEYDGTEFAVGVWHRRSKASAERKAVRELKRYNRRYTNLDSGFVVQ